MLDQTATHVCQHCGAPLALGETGGFCGESCAGAFGLIQSAGLSAFYDRMTVRPSRPQSRPARSLLLNVASAGDGECRLDLMVDGLNCPACVWLIEIMLRRRPEITAARVNYSTRRLTMRWKGAPVLADSLVPMIEALGFRLTPFDPALLDNAVQSELRGLMRCLAVAGFAAGNIMLLSVSVWAGHSSGMGQATRDLLHWLSALIALPAIFYAGQPFFRSGLAALRRKRTNMDVPISIGVVMAAAMSLSETLRHGGYAYFDSAVTLLFFLLIGRVLDLRARGRNREAAAHLLSLGATGATRLQPDGRAEMVALSALRPGDLILVAAGERVPADGQVASGVSDLDASLLTGESLPLAIAPKAKLFAGQINLTAPITLRVGATGEATLLAEIVRLMEAAEQGQARYRILADRLTPYYAPLVHCAALATFLYWRFIGAADWQTALLYAVSVLIITCPCALGLAVPAAQVAASGALFRRGILLKSATALERLAAVDRVIFDKTGTLTRGVPKLAMASDPGKLSLAAGIARASLHPLARALAASCPDAPLQKDVEELPGRGLRAGAVRLGSRRWIGLPDDAAAGPELWLSIPGEAPCRFAFTEDLRSDAANSTRTLDAAGYRLALLSGDRPAAVAPIAELCGIAEWHALQSPADKAAYLQVARAEGAHVLMVGDGLNDAPALAAADVSISPSSAVDIAQNGADVVFQGDSLAVLPLILTLSRRTRRVILQNLAFAVFYNLAAVPLAVAGLVTPPIAAILMSSSSILVVLNALRLARQAPEGRK